MASYNALTIRTCRNTLQHACLGQRQMYTRLELTILRKIYFLCCVEGKRTLKENIIKKLPIQNRPQGGKAFDELVRRNLLTLKRSSKGELVSLNSGNIRDVRQFLDPGIPENTKDKPPIEDSINSRYDKRPFHFAYGDKTVRGINAKYSYHKNLSDPTTIIAYVIVDGEIKNVIDLGSFNKESLLSKAIRRIDEKYGGRLFTKADVYSLGKDIEGNRQQPKAVIDMLLFYGYIIQTQKRYYQRTNKALPQPGLDVFLPITLRSETEMGTETEKIEQ